MKFFVDTANVEEIRKANDMGIICGVTTNPALIAKGAKFRMVHFSHEQHHPIRLPILFRERIEINPLYLPPVFGNRLPRDPHA